MDIILEVFEKKWKRVRPSEADPKLQHLLNVQMSLYNDTPETFKGDVRCVGADGKWYMYYSMYGILGYFVEVENDQANQSTAERP